MKTITKIKVWGAVAAAVVVAVVVVWLTYSVKTSEVRVETDNKIDITPEQIQAIKAIGEWEFLSVSTEEMVDTMRKGIFSDDHLVRIYYGTLRLGVNLHDVEPGWIMAKGDTVIVRLPPIGLLDKDFIDETRTRSFYESGHWKPADRQALYRKAYQKMLAHGLTKSNLSSAETNADAQVRNIMRSMGFANVVVRFE